MFSNGTERTGERIVEAPVEHQHVGGERGAVRRADQVVNAGRAVPTEQVQTRGFSPTCVSTLLSVACLGQIGEAVAKTAVLTWSPRRRRRRPRASAGRTQWAP